jgi:hypothetical protein
MMTAAQHGRFWRLWSRACKGQGWTASEAESKRHEILSDLGFESARYIDSTRGFDRVRKRLEALADVLHNERPDAGQRRRLFWRIGQLQGNFFNADYPAHSMQTLLKTRFKIIPGQRLVSDLETEELVNLLRTLTARLASWKQRQALMILLRDLMLRLALCKAWPASAPGSQAASNNADCPARARPLHAPCTAIASALQPLFSALETELPAPFFVGS